MSSGLVDRLQAAWEAQLANGFLLGDPRGGVETRVATDPSSGVEFRFRWLPHREIRGDPMALERQGILSADRDESLLFRDPRDPLGHHCSLCPANVALCHPAEILLPIVAGGKQWQAGANFAWLGDQHFTIISDLHEDQTYDRSVLEAAVDLAAQTDSAFRVVFNESGVGASIPWHLHLQITVDPFPLESLRADAEATYPLPIMRFPMRDLDLNEVDDAAKAWASRDSRHHRLNLVVLPDAVVVVPRDSRHAVADNKGEMGGFETAGDFIYSDAAFRSHFETADLATARSALGQICPPALRRDR